MNQYRIFFFIISLTIIKPVHAVVILVHGSFSTLSSWCKPNGAFFDVLEQQAQLLNHKVVPFSWSGVPTDAEIIRGGQALAKVILSYPPDEEKILIGHSHGGNVIIFASHLLHQAHTETSSDYEFLSSLIVQADTNQQPQNSPHGLLHDYLPTLRNKKAKEQLRKIVLEAIDDIKRSSLEYKNCTLEKSASPFLIKKVYVLGTPVEPKKYYPNMNIINTFISLYSTGDFVQPVFGLYKRTYPLHERIANLSVWLDGSGSFIRPNKPAHHELHHPLIGEWILAIPEILQEQKQGNFEVFSCNQNGLLSFKKNKTPTYHVHKNKKSLRTLLPQALL